MFLVTPDLTGRHVEAWSADRLPFEPKGWKRDFRDELRAALVQLVASAGEILAAEYVSEIRAYADTENVLLYNVGQGPLRAAAANGLRFERRFGPPPARPVPCSWAAPHYYRYRLIPRDQQRSGWRGVRRLAAWPSVSLGRDWSASPAAVWFAVRRAVVADHTRHRPVQHFAVCLTLDGRARPAGVTKVLFDGAIAALHRYQGSAEAEVAARVAATLGIRADEVASLLCDDTAAVLGDRDLVRPRLQGVQWNPQDEACVLGRLVCTGSRSSAGDSIAGEVWEVVAS